jgi:hypothetical protein
LPITSSVGFPPLSDPPITPFEESAAVVAPYGLVPGVM